MELYHKCPGTDECGRGSTKMHYEKFVMAFREFHARNRASAIKAPWENFSQVYTERNMGGYLHDLFHSPLQLTVLCLRSCNTEALEHVQGHARDISQRCTSCRAEEVAPDAMKRVTTMLAGEPQDGFLFWGSTEQKEVDEAHHQVRVTPYMHAMVYHIPSTMMLMKPHPLRLLDYCCLDREELTRQLEAMGSRWPRMNWSVILWTASMRTSTLGCWCWQTIFASSLGKALKGTIPTARPISDQATSMMGPVRCWWQIGDSIKPSPPPAAMGGQLLGKRGNTHSASIAAKPFLPSFTLLFYCSIYFKYFLSFPCFKPFYSPYTKS